MLSFVIQYFNMPDRKLWIQKMAPFSAVLFFGNNVFANKQADGEGLVVKQNEGESILLRDGTFVIKIKMVRSWI